MVNAVVNKTLYHIPADRVDEVMAFCPVCKSMETVWLTNGELNQTRKFSQNNSHIYHDCGSHEPCRLYMSV